jgi:hypothetical protein
MSDTETVLSDDLQQQIQKLANMEDVLERHFQPAMQAAEQLLSAAIEPNIPTLTGYAREKFGTHTEGSGLNLTGYIGWSGRPTAWWMNVVESGARPHDLTKGKTVRSRAGMARFKTQQESGSEEPGVHVRNMATGAWTTMHTHPGFSGRFLLSGAYEENESAVEDIFSAAADAALEEVAVHA